MTLIGKLAQTAAALWILNVWFNRFDKDTGYRGGDAKNMKEEFEAYGLSETTMYAVGAAKVSLAGLLLVGHAVPPAGSARLDRARRIHARRDRHAHQGRGSRETLPPGALGLFARDDLGDHERQSSLI